ncbi:MAG: NUDIX hydrolase [Actinomycetes bacterium]
MRSDQRDDVDPAPRVPCVGALVYDEHGRLLLVQRVNPPAAGSWSLPGGRVEAGEDDAVAVAREVAEETGLTVDVHHLVGEVERDAPDRRVYVIRDYACSVRGDAARRAVPGDDAADVRWVDRDALARLQLAPLLRETLTEWDALPRG